MTRAANLSKLVTDANLEGTLDVAGAFTSLGIDDNADATAITIDSSENVLVAKTATNYQTVGVEAKSTGQLWATADQNNPIIAVRKTNDGKIQTFYKDTTEAGSIGNAGARLFINSGNVGLNFAGDGSNQILPSNAGANRDDAIILGTTNVRFKDLYLSGSVFLGGTGSSNALDDYEEGTWTPSLVGLSNSPSFHNNTGRYTKIGRVCTAQFFQQTNVSPTFSTGTNAFKIGGLPFSVDGSGYTGSQGTVSAQGFHYIASNNNQSVGGGTGGASLSASVNTSEQMQFQVTNSGGTRGEVNNNGAAQGYIIEATVTYFTSD